MTLIAGAQLVEWTYYVEFRDQSRKKRKNLSGPLLVAEFNVNAGATHEGMPDVEAFVRTLRRTGYKVVRQYFLFSDT